jgi:lysophospholipase L1-like esterase
MPKPARKSPRRRTRAEAARDRIPALGREFEGQRVRAHERRGPEAGIQRTVKVVAEGDSWFSYFPAYDILACLRHKTWNQWEYKVKDRAKAGALLNDMVYGRDMVETYQLLEEHRPEVFLFSGGGNDIAGQELFVMLYNNRAVEMHSDLPEINKNILKGLVAEVFGQAYRDLIGLLRFKMAEIGKPNMPIVFHGYDHAIPDGRGWGGGLGPLPGPWLDPSLSRKGYDREADKVVRRAIVRELIDAFNEMLASIARSHPNTHYVNLRGVLSDKDWGNELHPTEKGFLKVAEEIEKKIRTVV